MPKIVRITTVPLSLQVLLGGQMRFMSDNGFEVIMVSGGGKEWASVLENEKCGHFIIPMTRQITPFRDFIALIKLSRLLRKLKPDIVHSHTPKAGLLGMAAAKLAGVKVRVHTVAGLRFVTAKGLTRRVLVAMERLTARLATHVWPNSISLLRYIKQNKLAPEKKLEVIGYGSSNGINLNRYSAKSLRPEKMEEIKKAVRYDKTLLYFLAVGRIVKDKGIEELVQAFERLYKEQPSVRLILVGDFEDELDPVSDISRKQLREHPGIIMAGWSSEVEYYMSFSYTLIHASHREGFPNVLLQAGAMQCPVICSGIEGNIDVIDNRQTGLIFEVKNTEQLYQLLQFAVSNCSTMQQYALNLHEKVVKYFDQPVVHSLLLSRYRQLLPGK